MFLDQTTWAYLSLTYLSMFLLNGYKIKPPFFLSRHLFRCITAALTLWGDTPRVFWTVEPNGWWFWMVGESFQINTLQGTNISRSSKATLLEATFPKISKNIQTARKKAILGSWCDFLRWADLYGFVSSQEGSQSYTLVATITGKFGWFRIGKNNSLTYSGLLSELYLLTRQKNPSWWLRFTRLVFFYIPGGSFVWITIKCITFLRSSPQKQKLQHDMCVFIMYIHS